MIFFLDISMSHSFSIRSMFAEQCSKTSRGRGRGREREREREREKERKGEKKTKEASQLEKVATELLITIMECCT